MKYELFQILKKLELSTIEVSEKNFLINYCINTALLIINSNNFKYSLPHNLTSQDLATDSICWLFIPDKNHQLPIVKAFQNWNVEINDDHSAKYFLFKIFNKRIEQELTKKLKESDPFYGKILRTINYLIELKIIKKQNWFGISYIIPYEHENITKKPIQTDFLTKLPIKIFCNKSEIIIKNIFNYLIEINEFPAIPLNSLINKIKHANAHYFNLIITDTEIVHHEELIDISNIVNESIISIERKIDKNYLNKGKIDITTAIIYKKNY